MVEFDLKRLLNWRLALLLIVFAVLPLVNAATNVTALSISPADGAEYSIATSFNITGNCTNTHANATLVNASAWIWYENNNTVYAIISNTTNVINGTNLLNFNETFNSPSRELNFTWYLHCVNNDTDSAVSANRSLNLTTTHFLTSTLSTPLDGSTQTVATTVSLTGSCASNATITGGRFWVYRSTGADYVNYANTSTITNDTMFSVSFTVPIEATTWNWNLECSDNYGQTANASANFSFTGVSGAGSGSSGTGCTSNSDCSSGYYCTSSVCVECNYAADGICRTCAAELGLIDPDCEEEAAPTTEPAVTPTQEPEPTKEPAIKPTQTPTAEPTAEPTQEPIEKGVTYAEAIAEIEEAQSMQGASSNDEAQTLINLAMAALEDGEFGQAKAYAQQAQSVLLSANTAKAQAGFDWTLPVLALLLVVGAIAYFGTRKKEGL